MIVFARDSIKIGMGVQQRVPSGIPRLRFGCTILFLLLFVFAGTEPGAASPDCESILPGLKVPAKLKTRGKPKRGRWENVDKVVTRVREAVEDKDCSLTLEQLFRVRRQEIFFPLTNNLLRTIPEESLHGVSVYSSDGERLGEFSNIVPYHRSGGLYAVRGYTLHYFQYQDEEGGLHSSGTDLLLDNFLLKWNDIKDRVLISTPRQTEGDLQFRQRQ